MSTDRATQRRTRRCESAGSTPQYKAPAARRRRTAIAELGYTGQQGEHMVVVENTPTVHNMVVCTLCSCYPWPTLGLPPVWYKSAPYRSRAVIDPRGVLSEFGLELAGRCRSARLGQHGRNSLSRASRAARQAPRDERGRARRTGYARLDDRRRAGSRQRAKAGRMNGVHDMGGMQDFGAIAPEPNEPVFHAPWEGRVFATDESGRRAGKSKHRCGPLSHRVAAAMDYFTMSYYEKWFGRFVDGLVNGGLVTRVEIDSGIADPGSLKTNMALGPAQLVAYMAEGDPKDAQCSVQTAFSCRRARADAQHQSGHAYTSAAICPRQTWNCYTDRGVFVFPDSMRCGWGKSRSISIRCALPRANYGATRRKLKDSVFLDMWDVYLKSV